MDDIQDFHKPIHILVLDIMVYYISNHILVHHIQLHILVLDSSNELHNEEQYIQLHILDNQFLHKLYLDNIFYNQVFHI